MTTTSRAAFLATLAALALLALPVATAQHGPPPGYTDPLVYAQDYAANQTGQASADPLGYAGQKATAEGIDGEVDHAAWLACWTAYESGAMLDAVCSAFFVAPGVVDAPAEAEAEVTETLNATGADALLDETTDALSDTLDDPTTAVEQVQRIAGAVVRFVQTLVEFVADAARALVDAALAVVGGVLDILGLGRTAGAAGLGALADGLLALVGLPVLGVQAAIDGVGAIVSGTVDGLLVGASATGSGLTAAFDGVATAVAGVGGAMSDAGSAVGDAVGAVGQAVSAAAGQVGDAISGLFGGDDAADPGDGGLVRDPGVETGTEADGLLDRVFGLL
jgi:hypothetical protein